MGRHGQGNRGNGFDGAGLSSRPRVAFVVNGSPKSAMGERAASFASRLAKQFEIHSVYRTGGTARSVGPMVLALAKFQPDYCYVFDLSAAGVIAAGLYKHVTGTPFVLDMGDDIVALGRVIGRGPIGMLATRSLEAFALRSASQVVVRGSFHRELLLKRGVKSVFIPDGVTVNQFASKKSDAVRRTTGNEFSQTKLVIGLVGSSVWIPSRQTCYGWELVEVVRMLKDRLPGTHVSGVLIGDGSGVEILKKRCIEYGVAEQIEFAGRVAYDELPGWLQQFDICLSTQTDDTIGWVRTTGKLPLYLAAGRFVLASQVGEAARVLPPEMLVEFHGSVDPDYPARLADRVTELVACVTDFSHRSDCVAIAREHFEYDRLADRLADVLRSAIGGRR